MSASISTLIMAALPASGKSEIEKYMASLDPAVRGDELHLGELIYLDDYPYVEFMRFVDEAAVKLGLDTIFFQSHDRPFRDPYEWGTLVELLNEDYQNLTFEKWSMATGTAASYLFNRINRAELRTGARMKLGRLPQDVQRMLAEHTRAPAENILNNQLGPIDTLKYKTVVIEFTRGGADGAKMPLDPPYGFAWSLRLLSPKILREAGILYVHVTPEESRRKNFARALPPDGSTDTGLFHGVPTTVMLNDYGCTDIPHLLHNSGAEDTILVDAHGEVYRLPTVVFDNMRDLTTFIRTPPWKQEDVSALHSAMKAAMDCLVVARSQNR